MCMKAQRINITLPYSIVKELQMNIPSGKRSMFIAKAVSEKLGKKKKYKLSLEESLKINKEFYKKEYKIWKALDSEGWPE